MNTSTALKIKETAIEHFARKGFEGTCIREIANEIGISNSTMESYFISKEDIFFSVLDFLGKFYTQFLQDLVTDTKGMPLDERIYSVVSGVIKNNQRNIVPCLLWKRITFFPPDNVKNELETKLHCTVEDLNRILASMFNDGIDNKEIGHQDGYYLASNLYYIISGINDKIYTSRKYDFENEIQFITSAFWKEISCTKSMQVR